MYLVEALKHNVPAFHEDRLTQILAATFNNSPTFQKLFLKFLNVPFKPALRAVTQVANEKAPSRPDLIIFAKEVPFILIESKVDARALKAQQHLHSKLKASHNFLLVRDPTFEKVVHANFKKLTWFDLFSFVEKTLPETKNPLCSFLLNEFLNFGKASDMLLPDRITSSDLKKAAEFFTQTRLRKRPICSFENSSPFKSLDTITQFFERVLGKMKDDPFLQNKITKFSKRLKVASTNDIELHQVSNRSTLNRNQNLLKSLTLTIEKEVPLKKTINGYKHVFLRLEFAPYLKNTDISQANIKKVDSAKLSAISYRAEVVIGISEKDQSYHYNDCIVFDDQDDIEFGYFYEEAVRHWKKLLSAPKRKAS